MADSLKTLADLVLFNDRRNADRDISDVLNQAPVLAKMAADTCPETTHYYLKYTTAPTVGFRVVNDGRDNSKSVDVQISVALKILDASYTVDQQVANGAKNGKDAYLAKEGARHLQQAFFIAERQMFYGTVSPGSSTGFNGFANETDLDASTDTNVVNAGGTTAATASSIWLIRTDVAEDAAIIAGKNGNIEIGETATIKAAGTGTTTFPAYYTPVGGWLGLQRGGQYSVMRICNITADAGKGATDTLIASALAKFPASRGPTFIAMSRRSLNQLRSSRTATNSTGAPAPFPTESYGVPIVVTDALVDTEALI